MPATQYRAFIGTLNNPTNHYGDDWIAEDYLEKWHKVGAEFSTGQMEKGENGTVHLQYYIHFKTKRTLTNVKTHCKHSNFQPVVINNGADAYCNKEDTRLEGPWSFGIRPARANKKGDTARRNKELIAMGAEKAVEQGFITINNYAKVKSNIDLYKNCTAKPEDLEELNNEWHYGPPGVGKTRHVVTTWPEYYDKDKSKFWNGYTNQETVLIDDIEKDETFMLGILKKIA